MSKDLEKINSFLQKHHVMSLATSDIKSLSVCSLFYVFSLEENSFIVASSDDTLHIKQIQKNSNIAGNILLETKTIGKIQGVQFRGTFKKIQDEKFKKLYFKVFPHAKIMKPKLWQIKIDYFKMTDNRLGFANKIIWQVPSV